MTDDTSMGLLAETLRGALETRQMSAAHLARESGVSVATLSRILSGKTDPSFGVIRKLAGVLALDAQALLPAAKDATQAVPAHAVRAVYALEHTDHTPESASKLLLGAATGQWAGSSTDVYLSADTPKPVVLEARQTGTQMVQLEVAFPQEWVENGSVASFLSICASALTGTGARLLDVQVPDTLLRTFAGPALGMRGVRDMMNKHGRPLLAATIRPMVGLSPRLYGRAVHEILVGGVDMTCDPTLLHHSPENPWRERFKYAAEAMHAAGGDTNEYKTHAVNVSAATTDEMLERALWAKDLEVASVLVDSAAVGFGAVQTLAAWCRKNDMILCAMGGRALAGDMLSEQLHAKLLRLAGADVVSTASPLRGSVANRRQVGGVLAALRDGDIGLAPDAGHFVPQRMAGVAASAPAVGGGHNAWHFPRLLDAVGDHVMLQCGGSVMAHPWGSTAGAIANRTAVEALVQARGEGLNLNVEGRTILQRAAKFCPELKLALDTFQEGAFLFGVVPGSRPNDATVQAGPKPSVVTTFKRPVKDEGEEE